MDPSRPVSINPDDAMIVTHRFLERCRQWAIEREIPKRLQRVGAGLDPDEAARLHGWICWLRFIEHAQQELTDGTLDRWFLEDYGEEACTSGPTTE